MVRFLLQAVFAAMEEEHEATVNMKHAVSHSEEGGREEDTAKPEEAEQNAKPLEGELEDMEAHTDDKEEREEEDKKPLDIQVESLCALAVTFVQWSQQTQRLLLPRLVLDPHTCSEVLRLHLLASGGYSETSSRRYFRYHCRGGYSDGDDPAIALRLRRPDLLEVLERVSIYDLSSRDKLEVLLTLCGQLLTFSVSREFMEECCMRRKIARRRIREIQLREEKRKKEAQQQRAKEKKEKVKKAGNGSSGITELLPKTSTEPPGDTGSDKVAPRDPSSSARNSPATPAGGEKEKSPSRPGEGGKETLENVSSEQAEGRKKEKPEPQEEESEEERRLRVEEELAGLYEELVEASNSVSLQPLGLDRQHRRYWLFPHLPGLFVEDLGLVEELRPPPKSSSLPSPPPLIHQPPGSQTILTSGPPPPPPPPPPPLALHPHVVPPPPTHLTPPPHAHILPPPHSHMLPPPHTHTLPPPPQLISIPQTTDTTSPDSQLQSSPKLHPPSQPRPSVDSTSPGQTECVENAKDLSSLPVVWSYFSQESEIEALLVALNVRGVRENLLKKALNLHKSRIFRTISKCPFESSGRSQHSSPADRGLCYDSGEQYLELYLREQILDTEEKIHIGSLGYLRSTPSREQWRTTIENSGAAALLNSWREERRQREGGCMEAREEGESGRNSNPVDQEKAAAAVASSVQSPPPPPPSDEPSRPTAESTINPSVPVLAQSLLDVQAGIEPRFLMPPLGRAVDSKNPRGLKKSVIVKESDICLEQWQSSLAQATSFSQIFVHLATLERAVMWSRSLMNVRCRICRRKGGDEYMLLCDGCDHGYHTYCLRPPLERVPEGDWFCCHCTPVTPVKPQKRAQRVTFQEQPPSPQVRPGPD